MSIQGPTLPILSGSKPYLGTPSKKHAEYLSAADNIATTVDTIYTQMIGAESGGRENKPLMIRDAKDFDELKQNIREAERQLKMISKLYPQGQFADADDIVQKAKAKFYGLVQVEYQKIKQRINAALNWEEQLGPYRKEQAEKSVTAGQMQVESDKGTMSGHEQSLFRF